MEYKRTFSPVIPWAVLGAGVAVAGAGFGMHMAAKGELDQYDQGIAGCADAANHIPCQVTPALDDRRTSATSLQTGAVAMYAVGGAAVAASLVLFYVGRPVGYRKTVNVDATTPQVTIVPLLSPFGAGAMASLKF